MMGEVSRPTPTSKDEGRHAGLPLGEPLCSVGANPHRITMEEVSQPTFMMGEVS